MLKMWNMWLGLRHVLAAILGTFLTRSGNHQFGTPPFAQSPSEIGSPGSWRSL